MGTNTNTTTADTTNNEQLGNSDADNIPSKRHYRPAPSIPETHICNGSNSSIITTTTETRSPMNSVSTNTDPQTNHTPSTPRTHERATTRGTNIHSGKLEPANKGKGKEAPPDTPLTQG